MELFRNLYRSQIAFQLSDPIWLQRCWLNHLPKRLDWPPLISALARFAHHHPHPQKSLRFGYRFQDENGQEGWSERLETLLSDFHRYDRLRGEDERSLLGGLSMEVPNTLVYAGYSPAMAVERNLDSSEKELLDHLFPRFLEDEKLKQQTIEARNRWHIDDLVFQDRTGRFYNFQPEKQTLRAIRKGKRQEELVHFGAFSLTVLRSNLGQGPMEMEYGAFQFPPTALVDIDLLIALVAALEANWTRLTSEQEASGSVPSFLIEGDDQISNRLLMTQAIERGLAQTDRLAAPAMVFGSHPLVSFAEFLAWPVGPRIFVCLKPKHGKFSYAMIYRDRS